MILPDELVEFLHGPVLLFAGTRSDKLLPEIARALGGRVQTDRETITFYTLTAASAATLRNLEHNGQVALLAADPASHTSYQFKGAYVSSRASDDADYVVQDIWWDKATSALLPFCPHLAEQLPRHARRPTTAITFRPREVYDQTPGPGAGKLIYSEGT